MKYPVTCWLLLLVFVLPTTALSAQSPSPDNLIPRTLFFKDKTRNNVRLSLDGSSVFYQKKADGSDSTLYYLKVNFPLHEKKRRFEGKLTNWDMLYDGGLLAVVQQDTSFTLYSTSLTSNKLRKVNFFPFKKLKMVHTSARFPNKIAADIVAVEPSQSGLYILDILSGSTKRLTLMDGFEQVFLDENFGLVAALRNDSNQVRTLLRRHNGQWKEVISYPFAPDNFIGGVSKIISVSKDGQAIYATDNSGKDKSTLISINTETGEVTELASDPDADIFPAAFTLDLDGNPTSVVAIYADTRRHIVDESVRADFDFLDKELKGSTSFAGASQNDSTWLVRKLDGGPVSYFIYDRKTQKLTPLFNDYEYLNDYDLATRKAYTVTTRDGMKLPVHVYVPFGMSRGDGTPKTPLPTIIYVHGGPWAGVTHWNSWFHNRNFQLLANRGYVVINMEFRGTTGLGKAMTDAGDKQWGEAMHYDIVDVATWAIKQGITNRSRLGIWGWSYGGYATNFAMAASPDLFKCGVSMYGISDLPAFCQLPFADNDLWRTRVGDSNTDEGLALLEKHSPMTYLKGIANPILLTTGSLDDRVPQEQSDKFASELKSAKKDVTYFFYPEEGHDYRKPESWVSFWAITEAFLSKNLGGSKQGRLNDIEAGKFEVMFGKEFIDGLD
ncbi:MAG: prolyl oligopeptidase family serine peptidase [Saprospiraceae bacterium]|nr:prolyl oligopeptidase family serine peptidase [Saprospiraceae bacterium]MCF8251981.1 prolyl oligopeptidase family serine peptidase [Saprospiraceae bacterium]MCF8281684.1 prolyl oligopeptidase family serine peptidase [Bacteroidales bacterium]MCF8313672.1 prolyl oligopeptidase family serine peptidase [Saprospiraceae bacterium]MCF8442379.1 prolyl oligopeptidase family serine peptidase [Saprospiraceae bacterium]